MTTGLYIANHSNNDDAAALRLGDLIESSEAGRCCRGDHVKMFGASLSSLDASSTRPVRQHSALRSDVSSHVAVRHQQTCLAIRRIFMRRSKSQAKARPVYQQRPTEFSHADQFVRRDPDPFRFILSCFPSSSVYGCDETATCELLKPGRRRWTSTSTAFLVACARLTANRTHFA